MTLFVCLFTLVAALPQAETIGGVPYKKLATREATYDAMRDALMKEKAHFGPWFLATRFDYARVRKGDFATPQPPEAELANMAAGGKGPDTSAHFAGKSGLDVAWEKLGRIDGQAVDLHRGKDAKLDNYASAYLYASITASENMQLPVTMGSDDGIRAWLNGALILDNEAIRSLDPDSEHLALALKRGVNHVLVKITNREGGFEFQINAAESLPSEVETLLTYALDRDFPPSRERSHYQVLPLPIPKELVVEVGGIDFFADGRPVVSTRRGDVFAVEHAYDVPPAKATYSLFASGLHEPLGAAVRKEGDNEVVYVVQRGELTRLVDADHDGKAERYETVSDGWGVSGNYHEFAFGPKFDAEGNAWVTLNVGFCGGLGKSIVPWRGFALKITPKGELVPVCDGLRSPNGFGANAAGDMFYVDNQGDYVATNRLAALTPNSWHGHPASLHWRDDVKAPTDRPERADPVVWFPYRKMGQSAADVVLDTTKGKFGPFADQLFVGDQMNCSVMRVALEKVDGKYQGACFPFLDGLDSGTNRIAFASDGSMFVGQTDRGWGSLGKKSYGLERVVYRGTTPFEIQAMRARSNGFDLEFTQDVDAKTAQDPLSYEVASYTYEYHADYGAPEADTKALAVTSARLVSPRVVRLALDSLRKGYVHEFTAAGVKAASGETLVHTKAYYTLVRIPAGEQAMVVQDPSGAPAVAAPPAKPKVRPKVLFLTESKGFMHDVVKRPTPTELSLAEREFVALAKDDFEIVPTQDSAAVNAADLTKYAVVAFYTTGELPISAENRAAFMEWMMHGGAFVGIHCASDTLYEFPPYHRMLGGTFDGHPWHQEIRVDVLDGAHPAVAQLERGFLITDEIYQFKDFDKIALRELLRVEPSSADFTKGKRTDGDYAISWCREYGQGRVFYTSLGHRPEVWMDPRFRQHLLGGLSWAVNGPAWIPSAPEHSVILTGDFYGVSAWEKRDGSAPAWTSDDGVISAAPGAGDVVTHHVFGDADIHVEFSVPDDPGEGEAKGNSGVYLMGRYEVQVLDSFGKTPGKGDCGAIYGQTAPSVNACKPALAWQTFDIRLKGPRIGTDAKKTANARVSVWLNGVLVQDDVELKSATPGGLSDQEVAAGPLLLQEHGHAVRYRNIWVLPR